jgi:hypothetical protein
VASIEEELALAKRAKAAVENIRTKPREEVIAILRNAIRTVQMQPGFSSGNALIDARHKIGLALPLVISGLHGDRPEEEKIDTAKSAIEAWIKELEAARV